MASFSAGTSFTDGVANDVTAAKLGALVNNATPTSGLIQDRTAETITATNDTLLMGDASDSNNLKRITVANFAQTLPTAKITTGTIEEATFGTTTGTTATFTAGTIPTLSATTLLTVGTGTASAPAITVTGDTNNGLFFPAADTIAATTNGTERLRIDSSGNVGIGTTSPASILHLASSGPVIRMQDTDTVGNGSNNIATWMSFRDSAGSQTGYFGFPSDPNLYLWNQTNSALIFGTNHNERLRITSGGDVLIGGTNTEPAGNAVNGISLRPSGNASNGMVEICNGNTIALVLGSTTGDATLARFRRAGSAVGSISVTASATAYNTSSDYRLKTNIESITNGIDRIKKLPVYRFNWVSNIGGNKVDGFIAHEVSPVIPEAINGEKDAVDADGKPIYQGIDQSKIVPLLTAALKEAIAKIETLESRVAVLEAA